ncbi:MAG: hypothetical protein ACPG8W_08875 [Candidatus Promineifilaceae bacterium]
MSKRKSLPQIDDLINPSSQHPPASTPREADKPKTIKTEKPNNGKAKIDKSKVTLYIPTDMAERLDFATAQARVFTRGSRFKASKSEVAEVLLTYALNEMDNYGKDSQVIRLLERLIEQKRN